MEKENKLNNFDRRSFIESIYADKKGRDVTSINPYTMYINIGSAYPNLPALTASLLIEISSKPDEGVVWASRWDKSIISVAPSGLNFCEFLPNDSSKGKSYVSVKTKNLINSQNLLSTMPKSNGPTIYFNSEPSTTDGFLISYFHMVNELVWDKAVQAGGGKINTKFYSDAVEDVMATGFSVGLLSEEEMIQIKKDYPKTSMRIYGSKVNPFVPEIMGIILT